MNCLNHNCLKINLENEYFKEKLTEFYKENKKLKEELSKFKNYSKSTTAVQTDTIQLSQKDYKTNSTNKCTVCKTNLKQKNISKNSSDQSESNLEKYNQVNKKSYVKLCEMHQNLLKKYEDEVNSNAVKLDLVNKMKVELDKYESRCKFYENEMNSLRKKIDNMHEIELKNKQLLIDLESYKYKCQSYQENLKLFDDDFFIDIENLKNNYDKAVKLNNYYKKLLEKNKIQDVKNKDFKIDEFGTNQNEKCSKIKQFTKEIIENL
ncbi:hypothetical protein BpHYR1_027044 [Brachionus plicatilis]|uniref:Uncharacterized protein n=1 Tax=Brachionus plicatilis TaxID=10195 RepID=A0A3M7PTN5_BRAPC|nr:hypothetical protein BpHYR1_027044 [Brachionus plicatilis]